MTDVITSEARAIGSYVTKTWPEFKVRLEVRLSDLFAKPTNSGLQHIWRYGSADIVVFRCGQVVCIIEPGGAHHFRDAKQKKNDARKWKLCDINGVRCLSVVNGLMEALSKRAWRKLVGSYLFPRKKGVHAKAA